MINDLHTCNFFVRFDMSICFASVAANLLECSRNRPMKMLGTDLSLTSYSSKQPMRGYTILVSGIGSAIDIEDLYPTFENQRKGGGRVESISKPSQDSAVVTFADEKGKARRECICWR